MADERRRRRGYEPNPKRNSIRNQPAAAARAVTSSPEPSSAFIRHEPCPKCGSSDALGRYDDGHGYCFSCGHYERGTGPMAGEASRATRAILALLPGQPQALPARRITLETCQRFSYWTGELGGDEIHIANYHDAEGHRVAQKIRLPDKQFRWRGDARAAVLFGQNLWRPVPMYSDRELDGHGGHADYMTKQTRPPHYRLILTEGEFDAMSIAQVFDLKQPVVSVRHGAAGALRDIQQSMEWISQFGDVVLLFDQDDAGEQAARECAALLPDRARIGRLPLKDANEMLVAGREVELVRAIHDARPAGSRP